MRVSCLFQEMFSQQLTSRGRRTEKMPVSCDMVSRVDRELCDAVVDYMNSERGVEARSGVSGR